MIVVHPTDPSTRMLGSIYDGLPDVKLFDSYLQREEILSAIAAAPKDEPILLLGHGCPSGLLDMRYFVQTSGLQMQYKVRGNHTVGFSVLLPETGQILHFSAAFSKVMSEGWLDGLKSELTQFLDISSRLGKIRISKV